MRVFLKEKKRSISQAALVHMHIKAVFFESQVSRELHGRCCCQVTAVCSTAAVYWLLQQVRHCWCSCDYELNRMLIKVCIPWYIF